MGELDRHVGFRSDRLRLPQSQLVSAAGHRSVKSACRKHAACHCQPEHRARPALRLQEHQQWCARIRVLRNAAHTVWNLETFVEYLPCPRQLGPHPQAPHGGRAAPRIPPAGRRQHRRRPCCRLNPARTDHIVPLKRGGENAPSNMQWQQLNPVLRDKRRTTLCLDC